MRTVVFSRPIIMSTAFRRIRGSARALPLAAALALAGCSNDPSSGLFGLPRWEKKTPAPADDLSAREQRQLDLFDSTVRNPSADIDPKTRLLAAQELIAMNNAAATQLVAEALRSGEPAVVMAVIDAMDGSPEPVDGLLPAAAETLQTASGEHLEKLSLILPRYGPEALQRVAHLARDQSEPPARRIGPIYALAAFRTRESAVQLMAILEPQEGTQEPPEITTAAGASLERLTGLPYGDDAEQWRRWWARLKDEPIENWLKIMVLHLNTRTNELEREILRKSSEADEIARRLAETLRDLFLTLSAEGQLERLAMLLDDDLAAVRSFALGRVERRLRDSGQIPPAVQEKLAVRVADPAEAPHLRLLAAQLLNDLNYTGTAELVVDALANERDPARAVGYLVILSKRPSARALNAILLWLDKPGAGDAAAGALWVMATNRLIDAEGMKLTQRQIRRVYEQRPAPASARLLAAIGEARDRGHLVEQLDGTDPAMRRAVAEGLWWAGVQKPLLDRVSDPEIYPFAMRLVAGGPADMATLRALAELAPPESGRKEWAQAVRSVAAKLRPEDLLAADTMLAGLSHVDVRLRAEILAPVPALPATALGPEQRAQLLVRLAETYLALGEPERAFAVLAWTGNSPMPNAFAALRFEAAVLAARYDDAAIMRNDVDAWIAMLADLTDDRPQAALIVRDEIQRRFKNALQGPAGAQFQAVDERLMQVTSAPVSSETSKSP